MTPEAWIGVGTLAVAVLGLVWGGFTWLIDLLLRQSKETITELKDDRDETREENQELREENQKLRDRLQEQKGKGT